MFGSFLCAIILFLLELSFFVEAGPCTTSVYGDPGEDYFTTALASGTDVFLGTCTYPYGRVIKIDTTTMTKTGSINGASGEQCFRSGALYQDNLYFATTTTPGKIVKFDKASMTRISSVSADDNESGLYSTFINSGILYAASYTSNPSKVIKFDLATMTRVSSVSGNSGESSFYSGAMQWPNAVFATYAASSCKVVKFKLDTMERVGATTGTASDRYFYTGVIASDGFAYWGSRMSPAYVTKININTMTRTAQVSGDSNYYASAVSGNTLYFSVDSTGGGSIVKWDISGATPVRLASVSGGVGDYQFSTAMVISTDGGSLFQGTYQAPGRFAKFTLGEFGYQSPTLYLSDKEDYFKGGVVSGNYVYFGTWTNPGRVVKFLYTSDPMSRVGVGVANSGERNFYCGAVVGSNIYYGTYSSPAKVVKFDTATLTRQNVVVANSGENSFRCVVQSGENLFFGTYTSPGQVVWFDTTTATPTRKGSVSAVTSVDKFHAAVIVGSIGYFGTYTSPGKIAKFNLVTMSFSGAATAGTGDNSFVSVMVDSDANVLFGTFTSPGRLVKFTTSPTLSYASSVAATSGGYFQAGVMQSGRFAHFGTSLSGNPGKILRFDASTMTYLASATASDAGAWNFYAGAISGDIAYFGSFTTAGSAVRIDINVCFACTIASDCNSHSSTVTGAKGNCTCTCSTGYTGSTCDSCATNYQGYPTCVATPCSTASNCNGHASSASGTLVSGCTCSCSTGYTASSCNTCATNYQGYPTCIATPCTISGNCNDHASSVTGTLVSGCTCTCSTGYTGSSCNSCATNYEGYPSCAAVACTSSANCNSHASSVSGTLVSGCTCTCSTGYTGGTCNSCTTNYDGYPTCTATACTTPSNCNGHADSVSGTLVSGCSCTCSTGYTGSTCNFCATNYGGYPTCTATACTTSTNCNGHAGTVTGTLVSGCSCTCSTGYTGNTCGTCATNYQGYPTCTPSPCTLGDCNNHATLVNGNQVSGCNCTCSTGFNGSSCNTCTNDYSGYPTCAATACTVSINCNNHASSVSGTLVSGCTCTCSTGYLGSKCSSCATNYEGYPSCTAVACNNTANCTGHASSVSGTLISGCTCTCRKAWNGADCGVCPPNFDALQDCGACAIGYTNYPQCPGICNISTDCSGHATSVTGAQPSCACTCSTGYSGSSCNTCATNYGGYPNCAATACTTSANCNGHASSVSGTLVSGCTCTCSTGYTGSTCNSCATNYSGYPSCTAIACTSSTNCNSHASSVTGSLVSGCTCTCSTGYAGSTCNSCATNYGGYPTCTASACTTSASCNSHADSVTGTLVSGCTCTCSAGYAETTCSSCATNYGGYPTCIATACTSSANCSGHASSVSGTLVSGCTCTCSIGFTGASCDSCSVNYENYPTCSAVACTFANCSYHASTVSGTQISGCTCTCRKAWNGTDCGVCPLNFDALQDCGACAVGYTNYPQCPGICNISTDCSGHATSVTGAQPSCTCTCSTGYSGSNCNTCATNYGGYPTCSATACTTSANCSGHASSVNGTWVSGCTCNCSTGFNGVTCHSCATNYEDYPTCSAIACTTSTNCNGHAISVQGSVASGCLCSCWGGYNGAFCESCAKNYTRYPNCSEAACTFANCSYHASTVSGTQISGCTCTCRKAWNGTDCGVCPLNFDALQDCGACAVGYTNYPQCQEIETSQMSSSTSTATTSPNVTVAPVSRACPAIQLLTSNPLSADTMVAGNDTLYLQLVGSDQKQWNASALLHNEYIIIHSNTEDGNHMLFRPEPFGFDATVAVQMAGKKWQIVDGTSSTKIKMVLPPVTSYYTELSETISAKVGIAAILGGCSTTGTMLHSTSAVITPSAPPQFAAAIEAMGVTVGAGASSVALLGGGWSAADAQVLVMLGAMSCAKPGDRKMTSKMRYLLSPFADFGYPVMVIGNIGIIVVFALLQILLVGIVMASKKPKTLVDALASIRFPGFTVSLGRFLLQGISFATFQTFFHHEAPVEIVAGVIGCIFILASFFSHWYIVHTYIHATFVEYTQFESKSKMTKWLYPFGWWAPHAMRKAYGKLFSGMNAHAIHWELLPLIVMTLSAFCASIYFSPESCHVPYFLLMVIFFFVGAGGLAWKRPYRTTGKTVFSVIAMIGMGVISLFTGISIVDESHVKTWDIFRNVLITLQIMFMLIRAVFDMTIMCLEKFKWNEHRAKQEKAMEDGILFAEAAAEGGIVLLEVHDKTKEIEVVNNESSGSSDDNEKLQNNLEKPFIDKEGKGGNENAVMDSASKRPITLDDLSDDELPPPVEKKKEEQIAPKLSLLDLSDDDDDEVLLGGNPLGTDGSMALPSSITANLQQFKAAPTLSKPIDMSFDML